MDVAITDLDDCYLIESSGEVEERIYDISEFLLGGARRNSFRTVKEALGFEGEYQENQDLKKFLKDFDKVFAVTLRPFWRNLVKSTESQLGEGIGSFDDVIMYPGRSLKGINYRDINSRATYLPFGDVGEYKSDIVREIGKNEGRIVFIDDSEENHFAIDSLDMDVDQYYEDLKPYSSNSK